MPKFSKDNQPSRRKGGTPPPLDTSGGLDPAVIERFIAQPAKREHLPRPRPHTQMIDLTPAPDPEQVADVTVEEAAENLTAFRQARAKREQQIDADRAALAAEELRLRQEVDKAKRTKEEQRLAERAQQITAEAAAMVGLDRERKEQDARREVERHDVFRAKLEKDLLPVAKERLALQAFEERYVAAVLQVAEKKIYSRTPVTWPHPLRHRFDGIATAAHSILAHLRQSIYAVDKVLAFGDRLMKKGPGPVHRGGNYPPGYHERQREISEMEMLLKSGTGHHWELSRAIENLIRSWAECIDDSKRYAGATEPAPQPTVQDENDPVREQERDYRVGKVAGFGGTVRDGAHAPENSDTEQERADPGRVDPVKDLPRSTGRL